MGVVYDRVKLVNHWGFNGQHNEAVVAGIDHTPHLDVPRALPKMEGQSCCVGQPEGQHLWVLLM